MRLIAFGGDARMNGAVDAAKRAGWEAVHIREEADVTEESVRGDAGLLPWPHSIREGMLLGGGITKARVLDLLHSCRLVLHGSGIEPNELPCAGVNPAGDELFLRENAALTAEGAICCAMQRKDAALMHAACVITGFGRIGQALAARLVGLHAFVIVCARSEAQMRLAHEMGAHPVPLASLVSALRKADVVFNTIPARVFGWDALRQMNKGAMLIELASPPYGADPALAAQVGVEMAIESGVPGRYAPKNAGAALFGALCRAVERLEKEEQEEAGGRSDG